jgi:predicted nuclease with TOPRIM domain
MAKNNNKSKPVSDSSLTKEKLLERVNDIRKEQEENNEKYNVLLNDFEALEERYKELEKKRKALDEKLEISKRYIVKVLSSEFNVDSVAEKKEAEAAKVHAKKARRQAGIL